MIQERLAGFQCVKQVGRRRAAAQPFLARSVRNSSASRSAVRLAGLPCFKFFGFGVTSFNNSSASLWFAQRLLGSAARSSAFLALRKLVFLLEVLGQGFADFPTVSALSESARGIIWRRYRRRRSWRRQTGQLCALAEVVRGGVAATWGSIVFFHVGILPQDLESRPRDPKFCSIPKPLVKFICVK